MPNTNSSNSVFNKCKQKIAKYFKQRNEFVEQGAARARLAEIPDRQSAPADGWPSSVAGLLPNTQQAVPAITRQHDDAHSKPDHHASRSRAGCSPCWQLAVSIFETVVAADGACNLPFDGL